MQVVIDGTRYVPAGGHNTRIGVAITTHNRADVLTKALAEHEKHRPAGSVFVVVDDGSKQPVTVPDWVKLVRNDVSQGIVSAKNACLRALMDAGCQHLFLWDDDAWPVSDGWHHPYIDSPEPHLAYQFLDLAGPRKLKDITILHQDARHVAYSGQRGVMLYYRRDVIEKIGGFDWVYGRGMYEHSDLAMRIYHAGLTSWAFADVSGSEKLIYSMDEHEAVIRSVPAADRDALVKRNAEIHNRRRHAGYTAYVPLIEPVNVVLTSMLTEAPDPQRGTRLQATPDMLAAWAKSIKGGKAVILADHLDAAPAGAEIAKVHPSNQNPYFLRWLHVYGWLRDHPETEWVWATDGTDVEMLAEPWGHMEPGKLYVGSEHKTLADKWMLSNHPASHLQAFLKENSHRLMLNAGLVGGDRQTVMAFAHDMVKDWHSLASRRFWNVERAGNEVGDMAAFNFVAYSKWAEKIETGPRINTVFKTEGVGREYAWWRHK